MSDSSLRSSFQQETWDITVELTGLLLKVERASSMDEPTRACFLRHLHSLKGAAVLVGESAAARLLHALEALFQQEGLNESCRDRRFFDAVLQTFDVLGQLASARPEGEPPPVEPLIERLFDLQVDGGESRQGLLARTYPGLLERHLEVLTDRQEERLLELGRTVCPLYAVEVSLPQDHLRAELAVCEKTLVETGEIVSCCGRGSAEDGRVRFWFLVATSRTADELRALMEPHGGVPIDLRIPPAATASRSGQTPDGRTDRGTDGAQTSPAPPELDRRASKPGGPDPTAPDVTQPASPPAPPVTERHQQPESVKAPSFDEVTQKLLDTCRNTYLAEFQEKVDDVGQWLEELRKRPDDPGLIDG
ncbi:MAG: Hpt domain-containing protein, partial [Candidatus Riflebacteria bacterium]|nr:Hpt domain-containing protein [Candidatus Riflebacteria bacterium]